MGSIETQIAKGKRRRKLLAIVMTLGAVTLAVVYALWMFFTKGYSLTVLPAEAARTQQFAVQSGNALFIDNKLYVIGSNAAITVSAQKFRAASLTVNDASPSNIEVELQPLPATLNITTAPVARDIVWSVNGETVARAERLQTTLEPGNYTITARHPAYETASVRIDADIAAQIEQTLTLTPVRGEIQIDSSPQGASVTVNGKAAGQTPLSLDREGGEYTVTVEKTGYQVVSDTIALTASQRDPQRNYHLQPLQATVTVNATPAGGALLVNGTPVTSPVSIDADTAAQFRYAKPGYLSESRTLNLGPGETQTLSFALKKEMGSVRIEASEQASVEVNGQPQGNTPLTLSLQALPTDIVVRKPGYRQVQQSVTPSQDSTKIVRVELLREFDARRREGKPLFVSGLGIQMIRVKPKAFTMGSPDNDSDRKSNEHQVDVDFSRPFWVSAHEITEAQYNASLGKAGGSTLPVTGVSWEQAAVFANWLSEKEGLLPFYVIRQGRVAGVKPSARGYRLPTEAEWEFIARLNRRAAPTRYVWGTQETLRDKQGNFADESVKGTQTFYLRGYNDGFAALAPVGSFKAERGGFYDLDGNAREWVHDRYTITPPDSERRYSDYLGAQRGDSHVVKGASYKTGRLKNIRASVRNGESTPAEDIGFRIARYDR
ncbi:SUMF1/EgtB/PvdO family nonheme iron enzyme [Alteromonas halophila]|uniref:PEGA domain-containing protein n=1 Tax=Alteromonas halophila TaxID=516698 RepID=A0A918MXG9_9ALTE|nr:SUMF1/EgtB/PvdO family nonheme iron enzyme [Alteromonas halophila]GGW81494.1 hypothetical protein GCM10007391_13350 [Alteromonas halophila]